MNESHLAAIDQEHFKINLLSTVYEGDLEDALEALGREAVNAVKQGAQILVLDDSGLVDSNGCNADVTRNKSCASITY